jgi:hypothetical protein
MNLDVLQKKLDTLQSKGQKKEKTDYSKIFWKPTIGKQQIRIVPSAFNKDTPFAELRFYYGVGAKVQRSPLDFGNPDPMAQLAQKLREGEYNKEDYVLAKKLDPKVRTFVPVIVRGEEDKGVRLWQFGKLIYEELIALALDDEVGDYTDIVNGRDLTIDTVGPESTGTDYNKSSVRIRLKTSPLSENPDQVKEWLENQPNPNELYTPYEYEKMKENLQKWLTPESDENEDEVADRSITSEEAEDFDDGSGIGGSGLGSSTSEVFEQKVKAKKSKADSFDELFNK